MNVVMVSDHFLFSTNFFQLISFIETENIYILYVFNSPILIYTFF